MFNKYQHVEKFGFRETEGIEFGECYIFPKIDGTNGSIWFEDGEIKCGSRNRELTLDDDNQGFMKWVIENESKFLKMFEKNENVILYGEFLVPHSLKTYRENAWRSFYVFDVVTVSNKADLKYINYYPYEVYKEELEFYGIEYIPPLGKIKNPTFEKLIEFLDKNDYLIEDGKGAGEGIVIKNYHYKNPFGRQTWAKIVTSEFKEKHRKENDVQEFNEKQHIEKDIVDEYLTEAMIDKVYAKIENFSSRSIPELLNKCFLDLIIEEAKHFIFAEKLPAIDFKRLRHYCFAKVKEYKEI